MRRFLLFSLLLLIAGCAHHRPSATPPPVVTPDFAPVGSVQMVNNQGRFVVVTFPGGPVPAPARRLDVFREGLKVGELKVTGPQQDFNTVADILAGDIQVHDEVKPE